MILQAMPYPEEAVNPKLFTNAQTITNEIWVNKSWRARGMPIFKIWTVSSLKPKSLRFTSMPATRRFNKPIAKTTLTACAKTVAKAAPATFIWSTATKYKSPMMLMIQAIPTKIKGERLSPKPRKIALNKLYATIKKIPEPQIRIY